MDIDITALAREIAARMDPDSLLDSEDVGAIFKCSARNVLARYAPLPDFPEAIRLPTIDGKAQPRWRRRAIMFWIDSHTVNGKLTKRPGRPRKTED